jgi:hypothetical protein
VRDIRGDSPSLSWNVLPAALVLSLAAAADGLKATRDLSEASPEDFMNIDVTTVWKKEQP